MPEAGQELGKMTIAEFDDYVANSLEVDAFELIDGVPLLVGDPTETHEQIASNIGANLKVATDKRGCRTLQGGIMVQASASPAGRNKFRPDVVVGKLGLKNGRKTSLVVSFLSATRSKKPATIEDSRSQRSQSSARLSPHLTVENQNCDQRRNE